MLKMAKASQADMDMAERLCGALESLDRGYMPEGVDSQEDGAEFDQDNDRHCGEAMRHLLAIIRDGSLGRVIWGMHVLIDPRNTFVDPAADTLEPHPDHAKLIAALKTDSARAIAVKLQEGQGTDTAEGRTWASAFEVIEPRRLCAEASERSLD